MESSSINNSSGLSRPRPIGPTSTRSRHGTNGNATGTPGQGGHNPTAGVNGVNQCPNCHTLGKLADDFERRLNQVEQENKQLVQKLKQAVNNNRTAVDQAKSQHSAIETAFLRLLQCNICDEQDFLMAFSDIEETQEIQAIVLKIAKEFYRNEGEMRKVNRQKNRAE